MFYSIRLNSIKSLLKYTFENTLKLKEMTNNSNYPSNVYESDFDERDECYGGCIYTSFEDNEETESDE